MIAIGTLCLIVESGNSLGPWRSYLAGKTCTVTGARGHWFGHSIEMYPVDCPGAPQLRAASDAVLRPIAPPPSKVDTRVSEEMTA